ncbi:hypothetical protein Slin14017_G128520 [Septoria linicola]|nr:hypothetical protein Slin14017_G128520 [Septoria linicola]
MSTELNITHMNAETPQSRPSCAELDVDSLIVRLREVQRDRQRKLCLWTPRMTDATRSFSISCWLSKLSTEEDAQYSLDQQAIPSDGVSQAMGSCIRSLTPSSRLDSGYTSSYWTATSPIRTEDCELADTSSGHSTTCRPTAVHAAEVLADQDICTPIQVRTENQLPPILLPAPKAVALRSYYDTTILPEIPLSDNMASMRSRGDNFRPSLAPLRRHRYTRAVQFPGVAGMPGETPLYYDRGARSSRRRVEKT